MTPQERQLVDDLFDRLARLEMAPRDAEAERAIADGLSRAPHALYALVQTVLVQDEALKRADARIRELGGEDTSEIPGFLDSMREAFTGRRTSVPGVRPEAQSRWNTSAGFGAQPATGTSPMPGGGFGGGSFLGTAAATAAGVIGGALLTNSIASLFGARSGSAFADAQQGGASGSPWDNGAAASDLARDAGANDIGGSRHGAVDDPQAAGLFGGADDNFGDDIADADDFDGGDFGGGDTG